MSDDNPVAQLVEEILVSGRAPEDVCAACPELLDAVLGRLRRVRAVAAQIDDLFPSSGAESDRAFLRDVTDKLPEIPGYDIKAVHGRGGMGIVYKARHLKLNRTVALKMLLSGHYASPAERKRFLREAEAVARLSHPHVVQVHDLGECEGRPYFTMEFIDGGTLAHKLGGVPWPTDQAAALIGTLAQAVQVAHDAGIVHRDLKPGNILLTRDGTPKISDFGLARCIDRGGATTIGELQIGTPSYMAPEQAAGKAREIGPATDVYALGAILYEVLTGRPPFRGETSAETIRQLATQEPVPPSRLNGRVPRDLQTICLHCLNKDPKRRYPAAAALAGDIGRFQAGEPIAARPTGMFERAGKWIRRRPAMAAILLGSVVIGGAAIAGALWFITDRAATIRESETDLQEVTESENRSDWTAAAAALDRARLRMQSHAVQSLRERFDADQRDLEFGQRLESIGLNRMAWVENLYRRPFDNTQADAAYTQQFRDGAVGSVGDNPDEVAARINNSNVKPELIAALDDWAICVTDPNRRRWLFEVARAADPDPTGWRNRARDPSVNTPAALTALAESGSALNQPVRLLAALGERLQEAGATDEAIAFLRRVQAQYPADFWANFTLGDTLRTSGNCAESVRYYQAAIALRPQSTVAIGNLGMALAADNRMDEAIDQFRQELRIDPQSSHGHYCLGLALRKMGRVDEAVPELDESVRLEPGNAKHHYNLALALSEKGELDQAIEHFQDALAIDPGLSDARYNLGLAMIMKGRTDDAVQKLREAIKLNPTNSEAHYCLGLVLRKTGHVDEAIAELTQSVRLDPESGTHQFNLALAYLDKGQLDQATVHFQAALQLNPNYGDAHYNLGVVMMMQGKTDAAMEQLRETLQFDPDNAEARYNLGLVLRQMGRLDEAVSELAESVRLEPRSAKHQFNLALALLDKGRVDEAVDHLQAALAVTPNYADAHYNLGVAMMMKGKNAEAIEQFRQTLKLQPNNEHARYNLGLVLNGAGELDAGIAQLQKAIEIDPTDANAHYNLGIMMMMKGKNDLAVEQFRQALKFDPNNSHAHYNLGLLLKGAGDLGEAIEELQWATEIDPSDTNVHYNLGLGLMAVGKKDDAIAQFNAALRIDPKQPDAQYNLGLVLLQSNRLDEAIYHYRQAIALRPSYAYAYGGLGNALLGEARNAEAQAAFQHCIELLPQSDPWRQQYVGQLQRCNALVEAKNH